MAKTVASIEKSLARMLGAGGTDPVSELADGDAETLRELVQEVLTSCYIPADGHRPKWAERQLSVTYRAPVQATITLTNGSTDLLSGFNYITTGDSIDSFVDATITYFPTITTGKIWARLRQGSFLIQLGENETGVSYLYTDDEIEQGVWKEYNMKVGSSGNPIQNHLFLGKRDALGSVNNYEGDYSDLRMYESNGSLAIRLKLDESNDPAQDLSGMVVFGENAGGNTVSVGVYENCSGGYEDLFPSDIYPGERILLDEAFYTYAGSGQLLSAWHGVTGDYSVTFYQMALPIPDDVTGIEDTPQCPQHGPLYPLAGYEQEAALRSFSENDFWILHSAYSKQSNRRKSWSNPRGYDLGDPWYYYIDSAAVIAEEVTQATGSTILPPKTFEPSQRLTIYPFPDHSVTVEFRGTVNPRIVDDTTEIHLPADVIDAVFMPLCREAVAMNFPDYRGDNTQHLINRADTARARLRTLARPQRRTGGRVTVARGW